MKIIGVLHCKILVKIMKWGMWKVVLWSHTQFKRIEGSENQMVPKLVTHGREHLVLTWKPNE